MACLDKKSVEHIEISSRVYWPCFYCHKYHRVFFILFIANSYIVCISTMTEYCLRMFCSDTQSANQCLHSVFIISFKWTFYPCTLIPKELKNRWKLSILCGIWSISFYYSIFYPLWFRCFHHHFILQTQPTFLLYPLSPLSFLFLFVYIDFTLSTL